MVREKWVLIVTLFFCMLELKCYSQEIPQLDTFTLNNGLKLYLLQHNVGRAFHVRLTIPGGKKNETACQVGYSEIIQRLLNEAPREKQNFGMEPGTSLTCVLLNGQTVLSGNCSAADFNKVMELLSTTVSRLSFTKLSMDKAVSSIVDAYKTENMSSYCLAAIYRDLVWYGIKHPLGRTYCQYQIEKVIPEQLRDFYVEHYLPKGSSLLVSGNFNAGGVRKTVAKHFVKWRLLRKADHLAKDPDLPEPKIKSRDITFINKRDSEHFLLKWVQTAPASASPDHPAFLLASAVFDRYLADKIEEQEGVKEDTLNFKPVSYTSSFMEINALAGHNQLAQAIRLLDTALYHFRQLKFTEADLETSVKKMKDDPLKLNTSEKLLAFYDPLYYDFIQRLNYSTGLSAIRPQDIQTIAKKYFNPEAYQLIVVGKEDWLAGQLDTLKQINRYQAWEFETCDEACKEVVIIKCHCEICYRRGQCYIWRFDPSQKNAIKRARSKAKSGLK
jgi:zinc protease